MTKENLYDCVIVGGDAADFAAPDEFGEVVVTFEGSNLLLGVSAW